MTEVTAGRRRETTTFKYSTAPPVKLAILINTVFLTVLNFLDRLDTLVCFATGNYTDFRFLLFVKKNSYLFVFARIRLVFRSDLNLSQVALH